MTRILDDQPWAWRFRCADCGTSLEADADDVLERPAGDARERLIYVECPVCGEADNFVPRELVSASILERARGNRHLRGG